MNLKHFAIFIGLSLLLHLLLLLIAFSPWLAGLLVPNLGGYDTPDLFGDQEMRLTVKSLPQKKQFIDTEQSTPADQPPENTPFEGDRNTVAASTTPSQGNPNLPNVKGELDNGQDLSKQQYSPSPSPAPPSPPSPPPKQPAPRQPDPSPEPPDQPKTGRPTIVTRDRQPDGGQPARPASPPMTFARSRGTSTVEGGASGGQAPSFGVKETEEGRYRVKLYRAIGSRWNQYVYMDSGLLNLGTVRIKFFVKADGTIVDLKTSGGRDNPALKSISERSIREVSGQLEPFSPSLKEQLGDGFEDEVSFTIY